MNTLICPLPLFQRLVSLLSEDPRRAVFLRVGTHHVAAERLWLARDLHMVPPQTSRDYAFRVTLRPERSADKTTPLWREHGAASLVGRLVLGAGAQRGRLAGIVMTENGLEPLHALSLVGAGMHTLVLTAKREHDTAVGQRSEEGQTAHIRWSRTIGTLGGVEVRERLVRLQVAVIGCGRSGSITALSLARLGGATPHTHRSRCGGAA